MGRPAVHASYLLRMSWPPFQRLRDEFDAMFDDTPGNSFRFPVDAEIYEQWPIRSSIARKKDEYDCC